MMKNRKSLKTRLNPTGKTENMYLHSLTCGCVMNKAPVNLLESLEIQCR